MTSQASLDDLRVSLARWQKVLPHAEGTYCQGIANKAFGILEQLLKQLLDRRLAATGAELSVLLAATHYRGNAVEVSKLPPGTLVGVLAKLAETDSELAPALTKALRRQLDTAVTARNQATHEVLGQLLKDRTGVLLSLIDEIVCAPGLTPLLDP